MIDEKILDILRSDSGSFISGEELSRTLGVSRTAIWKHISKLRDEGYEISSQPHLGYKLVSIPDKLTSIELGWRLDTEYIGKKIYSYDSTDSTNDIAYGLAEEGAREGVCVFAEGQGKGRGRLGRRWYSPNGKGIYLSLILRPDITPQEAPKMTILAAVSCANVLRRLYGFSALIKWPNDILINDRKICGILTEMNAELDRIGFIVLGIGINVNADKKDLPKGGGSIRSELGKPVSRLELAKELMREIEAQYNILKRDGFGEIVRQWQTLSATLSKHVRVKLKDREPEGYAIGIDESGALLLRHDNGFIERLAAGDVTMLR
ncbi:MAG: biotin--[acetyl-CoA-carboxylase] ligase [Candidatus Omnitrophica bacterium CG1_02_49_10]|nr:MAG: biotin--[acetyl-CoA-carboxylase] ligase [Candidatus Omnitrophica bacterium CG1_02_49_10]